MENGKSSSGKCMLIGFDASRAFVSEATGTENYSLSLLKALAKIDKKNRYRIYLRGSQSQRVKESKWPKSFEFVPIRPRRFWTQLGLAWETWRHPVDVLFVPAHTLPILRRRSFIANGLWGKFLLSRLTINDQRSTKYMVTIHDLGVEYLPNFHKFPQRYYLDFASKYAARHADAIIAVSQATKDDLAKRYKADRKKVFVVHEGVDTGFFKPQSKSKVESVKSKYKIRGNYILFVGTVQPRKNLEMLIEAFSRVTGKLGNWETGNPSNLATKKPSYQFIIAGKLGWDYREILEAPKRYGIEKRVKFLKYVNVADLPALYSGAAVFVFPSLFEGFGLPILEAISCGCSVVTSDIGPHREILREFEIKNWLALRSLDAGGKFEIPTSKEVDVPMTLAKVNDTSEWARVLYQYISQYDNRLSYASKIADLASFFSWDVAAAKTVSVFEKLV